jgi:hypothetical protein
MSTVQVHILLLPLNRVKLDGEQLSYIQPERGSSPWTRTVVAVQSQLHDASVAKLENAAGLDPVGFGLESFDSLRTHFMPHCRKSEDAPLSNA